MIYAENAKTNFSEALEIYEGLLHNNSISTIEKTKFCIAIQKYLENYVRWCSCSPAEANAYQVFVKSTPLWEIIQLPPNKWKNWLEDKVKETVEEE
ncbi:MAG: hypothetical protein HRT87_07220 [Legionellales bacterium]|nr:hypothetical protein [Legionellales bacterium]